MIKQFTGYGITKLQNSHCGYENKPKNKVRWCSFPSIGKKPYKGIAKYISKKYKCDGYMIKNMNTTKNGKRIKYQTKFIIINPKNKLKVIYDDQQPPEIKKLVTRLIKERMKS